MIFKIGYVIQILFLLSCIYMAWRSRRALNGLANVMLILYAFLIIRRLDDMARNPEDVGIFILSSIVVLFVTLENWKIYKARHIYEFYLRNRQKRIAEYESMREKSERTIGKWSD